MKLQSGKIARAAEIAVILFGAFMVYQILVKILGGSWSTEDLIIGLLMFNLGCIFTIVIMLVEVKSDQKHFRSQFGSLAGDFKALSGEFRNFSSGLRNHLAKE